MALSCCKNGLHIFECPKCGFKSTTLGQMVKHKIIHKREMIVVLEQENKLVQKPWYVPKEIQLNQNQDSNYCKPDNVDFGSKRDIDTMNLSNSDNEANNFDIDDPTVIFENKDLANKDGLESNGPETVCSFLTCMICDTKFQEKKLYEDHIQMHTITTKIDPNTKSRSVIFKFKCEKCDFKSEDIKEFDTHKKVHYKNEAHLCKKCGRNFQTISQLRRHDNKMHSKPYMCQTCPFQTKYHHSLIRHLRGIHSISIDLYSIKSTELNFNQQSKSNNHSFNDSSRRYKCSTCEKSFSKKILLENHMPVHSDERPFHCSLCDYKAKWDKNLKVHMKKQHKSRHKLINNKNIINKVKCDKSIQHTTHSVKTCKCLICGKMLKNNTCLQRHMIVHSDEKPYHCLLCDYKSKWNKNLRSHMTTHKNIPKFGNKENIVDTEKSNGYVPKISSDKESFVCNICKYICMSSSYLTEHMKIHRNDKIENINHTFCSEKDTSKSKHKESNYHSKTLSNLKINVKDNNPTDDNTANTPKARAKMFFNCEYKSKWSENLRKHTLKYDNDVYVETNKKRNLGKDVHLKEKATHNDSGQGAHLHNKLIRYKQGQNKSIVKLYPCKLCFYKSVYKSSLTKHMSTYHPNRVQEKQQCINNDITQKNNPQTSKHFNGPRKKLNMMTKSKKQFGCSYCEYTSKWCIGDVYRHMKRKHGKVGTVITKPQSENAKIIRKSSKSVVEKTFEYYNQFGCSYCSFISKKSSNDVHEHMIKVHRKMGDIIIRKIMKKMIKTGKKTVISNISESENRILGKSISNPKKVHKCNKCSYTSYENKNFKKHLTYHNQESGPVIFYKCPECLQCYKMKARLLLHMESHVGTQFNKARICPGCNKSFNSDRMHTFSHIKKCLS